MNTCKTCKFWSVNYNVKDGVADCEGITVGRPRRTNYNQIGTVGQAWIEMEGSDLHGVDAYTMTHEDFGCTLHQVPADDTYGEIE